MGDNVERSTEITPSEPQQPTSYACNFCDKTFPTFMALRGHQNGHKEDFARTKHVQNRCPIGTYCGLTLKDSSLGLGRGFTEPLPWFAGKGRAPARISESTSVPPKLTTSKFFGVDNFFHSAPTDSAPLPEIDVTIQEDDVANK